MRNLFWYRATALIVGLALLGAKANAAPVTVSLNQPVVLPPFPANDFLNIDLDLNNDGTPDIRVEHQSFRETHINFADSVDSAYGLNGASILSSAGIANALSPGDSVGPVGTFSTALVTLIDTESYRDPVLGTPGNLAFLNPDVAVGVQIPVGGQNFYAWLGVQSKDNTNQVGTNTLLLHDFGYETSANTAVVAQAPEPPAASVAAVFTLSLTCRRRRRT